jgi:hypothetical protein
MGSTTIDVRNFGTDSTAINNAIATAQASKITEVCLEPIRYTINQDINVPDGIWLRGCGWSGNLQWGTILEVPNGDTSVLPIRVIGNGVRITDLAFDHPQPNPAPGWQPIQYNWCIDVSGANCFIERVHLYRPARGIRVGTGQQFYREITGQPLVSGIQIDVAEDVIHIDDVHFWPFWYVQSTPEAPDYVADWTRNNADAILSFRNDNPQFGRLFMLNYRYGMFLGQNNYGATSKFSVGRLDADYCRKGLYIDKNSNSVTGDVSVLTTQADGTFLGGVGLHLEGNGARIRVSQLRATNHWANGARVDGNGNKLAITHAWIEGWNQSGQGFPGIEAAAGNEITVGKSSWYDNGNGAPSHNNNVQEV